MNRNTQNLSKAKNEITSGPRANVKNGFSMNHSQTVVRDRLSTGPRASVKNGLQFNHNQTIVRG